MRHCIKAFCQWWTLASVSRTERDAERRWRCEMMLKIIAILAAIWVWNWYDSIQKSEENRKIKVDNEQREKQALGVTAKLELERTPQTSDGEPIAHADVVVTLSNDGFADVSLGDVQVTPVRGTPQNDLMKAIRETDTPSPPRPPALDGEENEPPVSTKELAAWMHELLQPMFAEVGDDDAAADLLRQIASAIEGPPSGGKSEQFAMKLRKMIAQHMGEEYAEQAMSEFAKRINQGIAPNLSTSATLTIFDLGKSQINWEKMNEQQRTRTVGEVLHAGQERECRFRYMLIARPPEWYRFDIDVIPPDTAEWKAKKVNVLLPLDFLASWQASGATEVSSTTSWKPEYRVPQRVTIENAATDDN